MINYLKKQAFRRFSRSFLRMLLHHLRLESYKFIISLWRLRRRWKKQLGGLRGKKRSHYTGINNVYLFPLLIVRRSEFNELYTLSTQIYADEAFYAYLDVHYSGTVSIICEWAGWSKRGRFIAPELNLITLEPLKIGGKKWWRVLIDKAIVFVASVCLS